MADESSTSEAATAAAAEDSPKPTAKTYPTYGTKGKYTWGADAENNTKASLDTLGSTIADYSWCDGDKKVSIYVTLPGLDDVPSDDLSFELFNDGKSVVFVANNVRGKTRVLKFDPLFRRCTAAKIVRKKGRDTVVLKLTKQMESGGRDPIAWGQILGGIPGAASGGTDESPPPPAAAAGTPVGESPATEQMKKEKEAHKLVSQKYKELRKGGMDAKEAMLAARAECGLEDSDADAGSKVASMFGM